MGRVLRELLLLLGSAVTVCCACPKYCVCQNLSESLGTLCPSRGLLSVPPDIDRRTVELRLGGNFIVTVGRHDFADMGGLVDLTLSRNTIGSIQDRSFGDLESLRSLHLDANRLTEIGALALRGLANLQHLVINNNQLHTVEDGALDDFLDTLEDLDMSFNNLGGLPWASLGRMDNLHTLSLDHNLIDFIPEGTFARLHKMARLDLLSNRLRKLPPDPVFARCHTPPTPSPSYPLYSSSVPPPPMLSLTLGGNPLHCNCELLWFRRLSREDDMETCASPPRLQGRYFWLVPEGEFVCRPPLITQSGPDLRVLEGQGATLGCRASGDPEPAVHWVAPDGRLVGNSSRTAARWDGTLDILVATPRDHGTFTCIAANAAGEATAPVRLEVAPLPHPANASGGGGASPGRGSTPHQTSPQGTRLSDITGSGGKPHRGQARDRARPHNKVSVSQVTGNTALVSWTVPPSAPTVKMYQLQYNSSSDHVLVYRMIPASSKGFVVKDLVSGVGYDLCVLAIWDDTATTLTATNVVGCVRFATAVDYGRCAPFHGQFLGGTMILVVGGIIVASLVIFIAVLMLRYRFCQGRHKMATAAAAAADVYSQTAAASASSALPAHNGVLPQLRHQPPPVRPGPAQFDCSSLRSSLSSSSGSSGPDCYSLRSDSSGTSRRWRPRHNVDRLMGAFASLDLRCPRREESLESAASTLARYSDREPLLGRSESRLNKLLALPMEGKARRSQSFDMGDFSAAAAAAGQGCAAYTRRVTNIWTKRSLSVNGVLLQYDEDGLEITRGACCTTDWVMESTV